MEARPTPSFAELVSRLDAAEQRTLAVVAALHAAARRRRPAKDRWCVDEVLVHIATTVDSYRDRMSAAIGKARAGGARRSDGPQTSLLGRWLVSMLVPGAKPIPSPPVFRPRESRDGDSAAHDALGRFQEANALVRSWIHDIAAVDGSRVKVASPALFLMRFNLDDVAITQVMHLERHLTQVERTAEAVQHH